MKLFFEVLHVNTNNLIPFLVIIVTILCRTFSF